MMNGRKCMMVVTLLAVLIASGCTVPEEPQVGDCTTANDCDAWCVTNNCIKPTCEGYWTCYGGQCLWTCHTEPMPENPIGVVCSEDDFEVWVESYPGTDEELVTLLEDICFDVIVEDSMGWPVDEYYSTFDASYPGFFMAECNTFNGQTSGSCMFSVYGDTDGTTRNVQYSRAGWFMTQPECGVLASLVGRLQMAELI